MDCCSHVSPFRFCAGLRVLGYLMIVLFVALVAVTYHAVVIITWGPLLLRGVPVAFPVLITFHILLVLSLWSYFMVVCHDPGSVPVNWRSNIEERLELGNSVASVSNLVLETTDIAFCSRCQNGKPPRCHHCSICERCVLKMDHHCVWVVNCVGARNYKYFLLFLIYTLLETTLDTFALFPHFIKFFLDSDDRSGSSPGNLAIIFVAFLLNLAFTLSLLCFVVMHTSLLLSNTTTIERCVKKKGAVWKYDIGKKKNFQQVFGTNKLLWFFPMFSKEDLENIPALHGLEFPVRPDVDVQELTNFD